MAFFQGLSTPMKIGLFAVVALAAYWYFKR